jgi:hypothetical protein
MGLVFELQVGGRPDNLYDGGGGRGGCDEELFQMNDLVNCADAEF